MDNGLFGEHHLHDSLGLYVIAIHKRSIMIRGKVTAFDGPVLKGRGSPGRFDKRLNVFEYLR
jgi:hypothetical protein